LTGDFNAVLQVSGNTINRLMASIHQNEGGDGRPTFPHSFALRIGVNHALDDVHGSLWAQASVPRAELIHGASDRFLLDVDVRARYKPDPGTAAFPEFVNGTVRAEYRLASVDENCFGWRGIAADYIWPRVVRKSVSFAGTAHHEGDILHIHFGASDEDADGAHVTRQIAALLATQFVASPQKVSTSFRPDSLRSLNVGGQSAVAAPVGLGGDPPSGRLDSIEHVIVGGSDFAVGIARDFIVSQAQQVLDDLVANFHTTLEFRVTSLFGFDVIDFHYGVSLTNATAEWAVPGGSSTTASITIKVWGAARTSRSEFNISFDVTQALSLSFNPVAEQIVVAAAGSPSVNVSAGSVFSGTIEDAVRPRVQAEAATAIQSVLDAFGGFDLTNHTRDLVDQLQRIDSRASAAFENAHFDSDGGVLYGRISLSDRRPPVVKFSRTNEQDGYSAFDTWFPGGRIDQFEWSWSWPTPAGRPGNEALADRFLLMRPHGARRSKFGFMTSLVDPLPGLDGSGQLCLMVRGVQLDPHTGDLVPIETGLQCSRFGFTLPIWSVDRERRLLLREFMHSPVHDPGPRREAALVEVGGRSAGAQGTNTLVVHLGEAWDEETARTLREGLSACTRDDAGLLVLALFRDGTLEQLDPATWEKVRSFADELAAPLLVNEDVQGTWSAALGFLHAGHPAWRLVTPSGAVSWAHDGYTSAEELSGNLDGLLFPAHAPSIEHERASLDIGTFVSPSALVPDFGGIDEVACPPPPIGSGIGSLFVTFVQRDSAASEAQVERLRREQAASDEKERRPFVIVVVDGAATESDLSGGDRFGMIGDRNGLIARRFDVHQWPTTLRLSARGRVTRVDVGAHHDTLATREVEET
jgi:hypothetical protein